jgi:hypothetical protein
MNWRLGRLCTAVASLPDITPTHTREIVVSRHTSRLQVIKVNRTCVQTYYQDLEDYLRL